ncbi:3-oxoacyl-[acyl-carrier-protein] reductase FabG-like [Leguminivora glycinivorella]|uniref:3-oxoacyl-[acyl-carrier-protein] reductase FabG-like n=1 Tax=Leguminivora glycinivorella TaxID=1035111 RepID=UPI00200D9ECA|nr:3-oxoacyl-[acyl-carrier-protein] reductase FabG-like [Leguminivora glycinivorella]
MSFTGKVAIVTGAASGIGAATAKALAREGAKVSLVDKDEVNLKKVAKQCEELGNISLTITADVTNDEDVETVVRETIDLFGQLDILINNAGTAMDSRILNENFMEGYDHIMNTNLRSVVYLTHLAAPHLIKTKGNVVNTSSNATHRVFGGLLSYTVSKACVDHFTRCAALDLAAHGVRVNAINPGATKTNIIKNSGYPESDQAWEYWKDRSALKKMAEPEEIADLILFLASDKARSITGSTYVCDNGVVLV